MGDVEPRCGKGDGKRNGSAESTHEITNETIININETLPAHAINWPRRKTKSQKQQQQQQQQRQKNV